MTQAFPLDQYSAKSVQQRAKLVLDYLYWQFPIVQIPLDHTNAHELLFATILSAQNTDKGVNKVTPALFKRYPTIADYAAADIDELKSYIKTIGLYNSKAKYISTTAKMIMERFNGQVPNTMKDLLTLAGVARKTASVVLWQWYGINDGFTVDTHVLRLTKLWGLTEHKDAVKVERDLRQLFPQPTWGDMSLKIIMHGRLICPAHREQCELCTLLKK